VKRSQQDEGPIVRTHERRHCYETKRLQQDNGTAVQIKEKPWGERLSVILRLLFECFFMVYIFCEGEYHEKCFRLIYMPVFIGAYGFGFGTRKIKNTRGEAKWKIPIDILKTEIVSTSRAIKGWKTLIVCSATARSTPVKNVRVIRFLSAGRTMKSLRIAQTAITRTVRRAMT
jgi:hypothetical protein